MAEPATAAPREPRTLAMTYGLPILLLGAVALLGITPIHDGDVWWHLKNGEYFLQHRSLPDQDPFVFTAGKDRWIIRAWISEVIFYLVFRVGGPAGLTLFKAAIFTLAIGMLWHLGAALGCPAPVAALILLLAALVARPRLLERPEIVSFLLLATALSVLLRGVRTRAAYLLVPLQVLWANMHSSFLMAIMLPWPFVADEVLRRLRNAGSQAVGEQGPRAPHTLLAAAAVFPASALTPEGLRLMLYPLHLARMPTLGLIGEVQPLVPALRLCSGCLGEGIAFLVLGLGTLAVCVLQVKEGRGVGPGGWALVVAATVAPFFVYRLLPYAGFILAAMAMRGTGVLYATRSGRGTPDARPGGRPALVAGVAVLLLAFPLFTVLRDSRSPFGVGVAPGRFPEGAARFILSAKARGPLFNSLGFGSYLLWSLFPRHQVFIHPAFWDSVSDDRLIARFFQSQGDPAVFDALVREYRIELLVLSNGFALWPFVAADSRWALVYWDQVASVYARRGGANAPLIAAREFRVTRYAEDPSYLGEVARQPSAFAVAAGELRRAVTEDPENLAARVSLAYLLMARGEDLEEALGAVEAVQRRGPPDARLLTWKAGILDGLGRVPEAERAAREAIRINPGARGARLILAELRARAGDREGAARYLRDLLALPGLPPDLRRAAETRLRALTSVPDRSLP